MMPNCLPPFGCFGDFTKLQVGQRQVVDAQRRKEKEIKLALKGPVAHIISMPCSSLVTTGYAFRKPHGMRDH